MDQSGGVKRLAGLLAGHLLGSEPSQLVIDQRQQLAGRVRITLLDGIQDLRDFIHNPRRLSRQHSPCRSITRSHACRQQRSLSKAIQLLKSKRE